MGSVEISISIDLYILAFISTILLGLHRTNTNNMEFVILLRCTLHDEALIKLTFTLSTLSNLCFISISCVYLAVHFLSIHIV